MAAAVRGIGIQASLPWIVQATWTLIPVACASLSKVPCIRAMTARESVPSTMYWASGSRSSAVATCSAAAEAAVLSP